MKTEQEIKDKMLELMEEYNKLKQIEDEKFWREETDYSYINELNQMIEILQWVLK